MLLGRVIIFHDTVRKYIPSPTEIIMDSTGHFVYDEKYTHVDSVEKYRALLKYSVNGTLWRGS